MTKQEEGQSRDLQTTVDNQCNIAGDFINCPAGMQFSYNNEPGFLDARLQCPLDSVQQFDFITASQKGLCECEATINDEEREDEPINCECYVCPPGSKWGFAYQCDREIYGPCTSHGCDGLCNGDLNLGLPTNAPTLAPGNTAPVNSDPSSSAASGSSVQMSMALLLLAIARMIR